MPKTEFRCIGCGQPHDWPFHDDCRAETMQLTAGRRFEVRCANSDCPTPHEYHRVLDIELRVLGGPWLCPRCRG